MKVVGDHSCRHLQRGEGRYPQILRLFLEKNLPVSDQGLVRLCAEQHLIGQTESEKMAVEER